MLELILALGLTVILLGAIAMAIRLNLRTLDARRSHVEEAQLARAILRMISEDIRGTVRYEPQDFSSVEQMLANSASSQVSGLAGAASDALGSSGGGSSGGSGNAAGAGQGSGGQPGGGSGGGSGGTGGNSSGSGGSTGMPTGGTGGTGMGGSGSETTEETSTEGIDEGVIPTSAPGLFGNLNELQIDVSRLPRLEQYQKMMGDGGLTDIPSDTKTVAYFVRPAGGAPVATGFAPAGSLTAADSARGGLYRRELDRAVTQYAFQQGQGDQLNQRGELLAPEVVGLEFRYFDGAQWLEQWDSQQLGGLPLAVEIVLSIQPGLRWDGVSAASQPGSVPTDASAQPPRVFRQVVRLISGRPLPPEGSSGTTEDSGSSSGSSSSGSSAAGGASPGSGGGS